MTTRQTMLACAVLVLLCPAAASFGPPVKTDYDRNVDFTKQKNVLLGKGPNSGPTVGRPDQGCGGQRPGKQRSDVRAVGR